VASAWVIDASPIICLARAGHLDLLEEPGVDSLVPEAVAAEILRGPLADPARERIAQGWGSRLHLESVPGRILEWSLGPGESAVLAAVLERPGSTAILDDAEARACARALGVPVFGTLGLILRARRRGRIPSAAALVRDLRGAGLFVDPALIERVLAELGESI